MSLTHPEDYLRNSLGLNLYWSELLRTVDEFDQLIDLCTSTPTQRSGRSPPASRNTTRSDSSWSRSSAHSRIACDSRGKCRRKKSTSWRWPNWALFSRATTIT